MWNRVGIMLLVIGFIMLSISLYLTPIALCHKLFIAGMVSVVVGTILLVVKAIYDDNYDSPGRDFP